MKFMHVSFEAVSRITYQDQYFSVAMPAAVSFAAVECSTHNLHNHSVENVKRYKDYQTFTLITQPCLLWKLLVPRLLKHIFVWHAIELNKQEYTRQEIWIYYYPVIVNIKMRQIWISVELSICFGAETQWRENRLLISSLSRGQLFKCLHPASIIKGTGIQSHRKRGIVHASFFRISFSAIFQTKSALY